MEPIAVDAADGLAGQALEAGPDTGNNKEAEVLD